MKKFNLTILAIVLFTVLAFSQNNTKPDSVTYKIEKKGVTYRHSIGASLWMIANFFPDPGDYYLLTYGYQLTKKDRVFAEFNTWKYAEPMGTYGDSEEFYPGFVRTFGIGLGYLRFHWKGLFTTAQATPFIAQYHDENDKKTQKDFQLYLQLAAGYRLEFLKKRWYVEPSYAIKYWPINTNIPEEIKRIDEGTPGYMFEFGLNFGFKF